MRSEGDVAAFLPRDVVSPHPDRLSDLYRRHHGEAGAVAFLMLGDAHAAEDIAQEAFVRLVGRFGHLRHPEAFHAYLLRTVVNLSRRQLRRMSRERSHLRSLETRAVTEQPPLELRDELFRALNTLPYRQRAALVLRYYGDLSEEATSQALGCSPRAVNALVSRGLSSLRQQLKEDSE